jgi:hypothetical protein
MSKNGKKVEVFHSMIEFEKRFFPKSVEKRVAQETKDAQALGTRLARESLSKIKVQLTK